MSSGSFSFLVFRVCFSHIILIIQKKTLQNATTWIRRKRRFILSPSQELLNRPCILFSYVSPPCFLSLYLRVFLCAYGSECVCIRMCVCVCVCLPVSESWLLNRLCLHFDQHVFYSLSLRAKQVLGMSSTYIYIYIYIYTHTLIGHTKHLHIVE